MIIADEILKYKKGGDLIEVGANIGTETVSFCDVAEKYKAQVFAYEPLSSNVKIILQNKAENSLDNLLLFNCLVSNKSGKSYFNVPTGNNSGSGFISNSNDNNDMQEFEVITLDEKIVDKNISLICIDVEGFEYQVLKGSENLININRPVLILEVNKKYLEKRGQIKFTEFCNYITDLGYVCYSIDKLGVSKVDFNNHKNQANKNWVCIEKHDLTLIKRLNNRLIFNVFNPFIQIN
ncbi:FkbM family methyltransferase [Gelidibacter maritimus]|uniref:FkbM family methyltransferase n=1 Tax=Gelidibacter maritimus TaxID=2761487 RepID=A0A7W2R447_9FLAO|nr:FkbM family methyltransferase [Gelidibacter maritimus]MBA6152680.1 FkbM family methyltransferase [Gelidibacter maritimus]